MKIIVEIDELGAGIRTSHAVADYVRTMLKVRSLRRAVGEALLEAEYRKKRLKAPQQLLEAQKLLDDADSPALRSRMLRRLTKPPATKVRD